MNKFIKAVLGFLVVLVPLVLVLGFFFNSLSKRSFYPNSGETKISGLTSDVKVYFDRYGVPHIIAENDDDMYMAFGYMHARDRLWQMDITRRVAEGRLAELFGSSVIEFDKLFRTVGISKFAPLLYEKIGSRSKKILEAYSRGVNSFIESHYNDLPVEFDVLNYRPEPWKPEHSLMAGRMMGWDLNINWYTDFALGEMVNKVGLEKTAQMFPDTTVRLFSKPPPDSQDAEISAKYLESAAGLQALGKGYFDTYLAYRDFFRINGSHSGSNSWVISGSRTESGKPMMANDPHLALQCPSRWYEVQLNSDSVSVTGMSVPGIPAVLIGHNRFISWGLTNLMADDNDFIILDRDSSDNSRYLYNGGSFVPDSLVEKISVKNSEDVYYTVRYTKAGPVISDLAVRGAGDFKYSFDDSKAFRNKLLTFKWTGFEYSDELSTFFKLSRASEWEDFLDALRDFGVPAQNFVYADVKGNIGYHAAGRIPVRYSKSENDHIFPSSGMIWTGFVDFEELPSLYNPAEGYIVTANTNPHSLLKTQKKDSYYISYSWEHESRLNAIREVLKRNSRNTFNDLRIMQLSVVSPYAAEISKYVQSAFKDSKNADEQLRQVAGRLGSWDGEMKAGESIGSVYNAFLIHLIKNIFHDELGDKIFHDLNIVQNLVYRSLLRLFRENNSTWFDNVLTSEVETRDDIIRKSLADGINFLNSRFGSRDMNSWIWGHIHKAKFTHPLGTVPALDISFNIGPFDVGGDQTTVNNGEYSFEDALNSGEFHNIVGPSMRMIVDLSDIEHSYSVISSGQSGQPLHPNYDDQARMWFFGEFKRTAMDESEFIGKGYELLILSPKN